MGLNNDGAPSRRGLKNVDSATNPAKSPAEHVETKEAPETTAHVRTRCRRRGLLRRQRLVSQQRGVPRLAEPRLPRSDSRDARRRRCRPAARETLAGPPRPGRGGRARTGDDLDLDGVVATNTTTERPASLRSPNAVETGGLSGKPIEAQATRWYGSSPSVSTCPSSASVASRQRRAHTGRSAPGPHSSSCTPAGLSRSVDRPRNQLGTA